MLKSTFSLFDDIILVVTKIEVNAPKMIVAIKLFAKLSLSEKIVNTPKTRVVQVPSIVSVLSIANSNFAHLSKIS